MITFLTYLSFYILPGLLLALFCDWVWVQKGWGDRNPDGVGRDLIFAFIMLLWPYMILGVIMGRGKRNG